MTRESRTPTLPLSDGVELRRPRLSDHVAWRDARLSSQHSIEPHWEASGSSWAERHSHRSWVRQWLDEQRATRRGGLRSWAISVDGVLRGEIRMTGVDRERGTAELGVWLDGRVAGRGIGKQAVAAVVEHAFDDLGLRTLSAPVGVENGAARALVVAHGFERRAVMRRYLRTGSGRPDHELWVLSAADRVPRGQVATDGRPPPELRAHRTGGGAMRLRTAVEVARYAVSTARSAARRGGAEVGEPLPRLSGPSGPGGTGGAAPVVLEPLSAERWSVVVGGASVGEVAVQLQPGTQSAVLTTGGAAGGELPTPVPAALGEALGVAAAHLHERLGCERVAVELSGPTGEETRDRLREAGLQHEGEPRSGGELWASVAA